MEARDELNGRLRVVLDVPPHCLRLLHRIEPRNEVQRHVDACGDACRGDDVAVVDEAGLAVDVDAESGKAVERSPVRRRGTAVEQARLP